MNRKGFTLIELLAVIVLVGILTILIAPSALSLSKKSKEASYNILVKNIVTSAQSYYEECEYGDLSDEKKYGTTYACKIKEDGTINTTLGALANTGFLIVKDTDSNDKTKKVVLDPRNKENDMSDCRIIITKITNKITDSNNIEHTKITYTVVPDSGENCPSDYSTNISEESE